MTYCKVCLREAENNIIKDLHNKDNPTQFCYLSEHVKFRSCCEFCLYCSLDVLSRFQPVVGDLQKSRLCRINDHYHQNEKTFVKLDTVFHDGDSAI